MVAMACISHHPTLDGPISQDYTVPFSNTYYHDVAGGMNSMTCSPPHAPVRYGLTRDAPPTFVLSARESLRVFGYHPFQGTPGTVITVTLTLSLRTTEMIYMRLVLGRTALSTAVRKLANGGYELQAAVPVGGYAPETSTVSLSAQALNSSNEVLDSVTFGNFTYIHIAPNSCSVKTFANGPSVDDMLEYTAVPMLRQHPHSASLPPSAFPHAYGSRIAATRPTKPRPPRKQMLMRTRRNGEDESEFPCATLELETSPEDLARGWDEEEMSAGRRLVRFTRVRVGTALRVSCAAVSQADYVEGDTVVSCIYRPDTDSCCVTSVDIIFLLERLVGQEFDIEEKNRIRRNLEGFRPKTVSKNRPDSSAFFLRIMNFPPPKPRNIEKDLKVFDWTILPQALDKIISRYTLPIYSEETAHSPSASLLPDLLPALSRSHSPNDNSPRSSMYASTPDAIPDSIVPQIFPESMLVDAATGSFPRTPDAPFNHNDASYMPDVAFSPDALMLGDSAAFDSMEFQTLREHKLSGTF